MQRIDLAARRALDSNSAGESGALLTLYKNGTNTPVTTFADADGSSANSTPVVADGSGNFPAIYAPAGTYRLGITDSTGADLPGFPYDDFSVGGNAPSFVTLADALAAQAYLDTGDVFRVYGHTTKGDTSPFEVEVQASADVDFPSGGKLKPLLQAGRYNFNWWGGFPDAVTNLTDTFQQFANFQRRHSYKVGDLYVPGGDKFYQVNRPFTRFSYQRWIGDGTGGHSPQTRIFNGAGNNTDFWANSVCYDGTFFGEGTGESVFDLLNSLTCNATTVPTTVLTGVSSHSLPDDAVICVASVGLRSGTSYRSYATLRRVVASTSTTITLDEPVYQPLVGGGQIWEVPTDPDHDAATVSIRAADAGVDRFYEGDAYLAVSLITEGIRFGQRGSAQDSAGQIVHASSMDALYRNCRFEGSLSAFAGNPFSRFLVEKCTIMGQHRALEMAYLSGEGVYRDCHFEIREPLIPSGQQTGGGYVIRHSSESAPGRVRFDNCTASWGASGNGQGTSSGIPAAVDLQGEGATWVGGFIDGGAKEQSIACAGEAAHIEGATVSGGTVSAIATTRDRASLTNCRVIPNDTPRSAAAVKVGARDGTVVGCDLGGGPDSFIQLENFTEARESDLQLASNTNYYGLNDGGRILTSYTVKDGTIVPSDTYSGKTAVFASEVAVAPAVPGFPTLEEIETFNGANTDRIINYNGSETDDGEYTRVYYVSAGGVMSRVDTTDVPVSNDGDMTLAVIRWNGIAFADDTTVAPAESGEPTTAEIIAFASGKVNTIYNYTGTDDDTDPITHSFYIAFDGTCTRVYSPTGNVTVDTKFRLELAMKIGASQAPNAKYLYVDYSNGSGGWTNFDELEFANNVLFEGRILVEAERFHADDRLVGIRANVAGNTEVMKRADQANHAGTNAMRVRLAVPSAGGSAFLHYKTEWEVTTPVARLST